MLKFNQISTQTKGKKNLGSIVYVSEGVLTQVTEYGICQAQIAFTHGQIPGSYTGPVEVQVGEEVLKLVKGTDTHALWAGDQEDLNAFGRLWDLITEVKTPNHTTRSGKKARAIQATIKVVG